MGRKQSYPKFLHGEDAAATAIRSVEWTKHPLGLPEKWSTSLQVTLNIVLHSNTPMFLFWGPELYCFYNDAFIESLETEHVHPDAMGKMAKKVWTKTWDSIKPSLNRVFHEGIAISYEEYLLPLIQKNVNLSPVNDNADNVAGVLAIFKGSKVTIDAEHELSDVYKEKEQILDSITDGFFMLNEDWLITHLNPEAEKILGVKREDILGEKIWDIWKQGKNLKFYREFKKAMDERVSITFEEYYEPWGKWLNFNVYSSKKGISVYFNDITKEQRLQLIHKRTEEISGVAGWELDITTGKVFMTSKAYEIYGLPIDTAIDLDINKELYDEDSLNKIDQAVQQAISRKEPYEIELNLTRRDGAKRIIRINGFPLVKNGKVTNLYGTLEDTTQEEMDKQRLEESIQKLKTAQKIGKMGYWSIDLSTNKSDWSEEMYNIWEVDPEDFEPTLENLIDTFHPDDRELFPTDPEAAYPDQNYYEDEHRIITPSGRIKWIRARITLHRNVKGEPKVLEGVSQDITEKKNREEEILQTLQEKETLLGEIHHRVKNNLAVISSMVQLQAYEEESDEVREKLMESVVRIISMASIHEQLYKSRSFSNLNLSESLKELTTKVVETMGYNVPISLDFKLDPIELNINQAIPCSLIVNEVVTNVIKHAFRQKLRGKIIVRLTEKKNRLKLSIIDNGVGMPNDFDVMVDKTLGLRLIKTLAEQLDADYNYDSGETGTTFSIQFEKSEAKGSGSARM